MSDNLPTRRSSSSSPHGGQLYIYIYIYVCLQSYVFHSSGSDPPNQLSRENVDIHIYIYVCMYVCMYTYIYIYIYIYIHVDMGSIWQSVATYGEMRQHAATCAH